MPSHSGLLVSALLLLAVATAVDAGTWLSFNSDPGLNELDATSPRRSVGSLMPAGASEVDTSGLEHLLANCNHNYFSRAARSDPKSAESARLCKALLEVTALRRRR
ncbi:hypothetical protein M3Y99_00684600 [Aphelenchoides fujianensis]|nr:hypothetical protein M3Y99_00684600 [Aphelenchoides fujianensis]